MKNMSHCITRRPAARQLPENRNPKGFTLIELLVVVAILAILAVLGSVNFQDAQARSKVARVHADMRTIATALEAYRTDARAYPVGARGDITLLRPLDVLTSPISYLSAIPEEPFSPATFNFAPTMRMGGYNYKDRVTTSVNMPGETYREMWQQLPDAQWMLHSPGPNRVWDVQPYADYDPTNGTLSIGDITRFGPY